MWCEMCRHCRFVDSEDSDSCESSVVIPRPMNSKSGLLRHLAASTTRLQPPSLPTAASLQPPEVHPPVSISLLLPPPLETQRTSSLVELVPPNSAAETNDRVPSTPSVIQSRLTQVLVLSRLFWHRLLLLQNDRHCEQFLVNILYLILA